MSSANVPPLRALSWRKPGATYTSNVHISPKNDIRHKYQTSIELGEGSLDLFHNIIVIACDILWLTNLAVLFADPAAGGRKVSAMSVLRNTKHVLGFFVPKSHKWQNHTKESFECVKILPLLTSKPFLFFKIYTFENIGRSTPGLKHFTGWLKQSWLCILRSSFSKIVCSQCLRDQSINHSSSINPTWLALQIHQFNMISSKWCVSKLLADKSFINHQQIMHQPSTWQVRTGPPLDETNRLHNDP